MDDNGTDFQGTVGGAPVRRFDVRDDHHCFGCGRLNPRGLHLDFYLTADGDGLWTPFTPSRDHEGFTGLVHGGIITTLLDEVMGWAVFARGVWAVTGKLTVSFRKPVEVGVPARAIGRVVADRGRVLEVVGELRRDADDLLLADATATFVRVPESRAQEWRERYLGPEGDQMPVGIRARPPGQVTASQSHPHLTDGMPPSPAPPAALPVVSGRHGRR